MDTLSPHAQPRVSKRALVSLLLALLAVTALFGGSDSFLNSPALLTLFWPLLLIALAGYWLRIVLDERADHHFDVDMRIGSGLSSSGLYLTPFLLARS